MNTLSYINGTPIYGNTPQRYNLRLHYDAFSEIRLPISTTKAWQRPRCLNQDGCDDAKLPPRAYYASSWGLLRQETLSSGQEIRQAGNGASSPSFTGIISMIRAITHAGLVSRPSTALHSEHPLCTTAMRPKASMAIRQYKPPTRCFLSDRHPATTVKQSCSNFQRPIVPDSYQSIPHDVSA